MRMALVAVAVLSSLIGLTWERAVAQVPAETVLIEGTSVFYPGASGSKCFDLQAGLLKVQASSPPGRTGESAYLDIAPDVADARPLLSTLVADSFAPGAAERPIVVQYPIDAGRYCVTLTVTHRLQDTGDPNRPERPNKQVWLRMTFTP